MIKEEENNLTFHTDFKKEYIHERETHANMYIYKTICLCYFHVNQLHLKFIDDNNLMKMKNRLKAIFNKNNLDLLRVVYYIRYY